MAALLPLAWIYRVFLRVRTMVTSPVTVSVPVICVGNVTVGGAGKTPIVVALADMMQKQDRRVFCISKGYGGKKIGAPLRVDPTKHSAADVGDEPLLLARYAPTIVAKSRLEAAHYAIEQGAEILILDDGLQERRLAITKAFLVVDSGSGFGNGWTLPAGPLRESLKSALKRVNAVVVTGGYPIPNALAGISLPLTRARAVASSTPDPSKRYLAFAGIAFPQKFFETLVTENVEVVTRRSFPDHYLYSAEDIHTLMKDARAKNASLITTEKDIVRIPEPLNRCVDVLKVRMQWENETVVSDALKAA